MGEFRVHRVRFFEFEPQAIHCMVYGEQAKRLAVSRSDGSVEIWSAHDDWYQEKIIPGADGTSIEGLVWQGQRLFSAGLDGNVTEYDLLRQETKRVCSSNSGPVWCLTSNASGNKLAAGTEDGCVVLFDTEDDNLDYVKGFDKQEGRILSIAWHVSEDVIVTGGVDNIRLWSAGSGRAIQRLTLSRQEKNKETVVWCVAITSDMTIISGDSRGKTSFWNGKQGTLIKSFQSHKAEVLCLAVNQTEDSVFVSGIDPSLVRFEFAPVEANSDWKMWVPSSVHNQHTHDVRALAVADGKIVSGGVDTNIILNMMEKKKGIQSWRRIPPITQAVTLVHVAKEVGILLLQYPESLEVWRLGYTNKTGSHGDILPLRSPPLKLVKLKAKPGLQVVCSAISSDSSVFAYSDTESLRIYKIEITEKESIQPSVSMKKIPYADDRPDRAHCICFSSDSQMVVIVTASSRLQVLSITADEVQTKYTFPTVKDSLHKVSLSSDDRLAAVSSHTCNVYIYNVKDHTHVCNLPKYSCQATALSFSADSRLLAVAYCDQKVYEFDVENEEYSDWCKKCSQQYHSQWLKRHSKITAIEYSLSNQSQLILQDEQMFCILDKSQPFPEKHQKMLNKSSWSHVGSEQTDKPHAFHICSKYKYLFCATSLKDDWLVIVERPSMALTELLPSALKRKKFGT